jgi:hypothetical protein
MREVLRQLGSTLALPVAIGVVWMVRSEPASIPALESATAYRAELAELPLPTPERLRPPGETTRWQGARVIPEQSDARQRRAALPVVPASPPVDLAVEEAPEPEIAAAPRAAADPSVTDLPTVRSVPPSFAALVAAAPSLGSHRARSVPARTAPSTPEAPAQGTPERGAQKRAAPARPAEPVATAPGTTAIAGALQAARRAALEPEPALARPDTRPIASRGTSSLAVHAKGWLVPAPTVVDRTEPGKPTLERPVKTDGPAALPPPGPAADKPFEVSLHPTPFEPSIHPKDLPKLPVETPAAPKIPVLDQKISAPDQVFLGLVSRPRAIQMIPEPGSAVLIGVALAALGAARRRRA